MENGVTPESAGSTENEAIEENGVNGKTKGESPAILPEKPRRGRPRKKIVEKNAPADQGKTKNDEQTNCNGTSAMSSLRTDNQKLVAVKTEIKKEIDEDQEYSAAFLCDTNLQETNGIKEELNSSWTEEDIKEEPFDDEIESSRRGRKRKRISYAEDPDVVFVKSKPVVKKIKDVRDIKDEEKEFSDDVKDMCSCQCKICDKIFVHHRMIKHIERTHKQGSKDKFTFLKLSYYRCKICFVEILFSYYNISQHTKRCHQLSLQDYKDKVEDAFIGDIVLTADPEDESEAKEYTDNLADMCQCKCNYCEKVFFYHQLKAHVLKDHKESMEKQCKIEFVKRTYYKCKICDEGMLFHFDAINRHLYTHKTSLKAYKAAHPAFTGEEVYNQNRKACEKIKRKRKYEFDAACIQKWSCTVAGARKYYSDNIDEMCLRRCRLCSEVMMHDALKYHLTNDHKDYDGNATNMDFVRLTYHRCKACQKDIIFTYNSVSKHTKRWHKLNFKDYEKQYNAFNDSLCDLSVRDPVPDTVQPFARTKPIAKKSAPKSTPKIFFEMHQDLVPKQETLDQSDRLNPQLPLYNPEVPKHLPWNPLVPGRETEQSSLDLTLKHEDSRREGGSALSTGTRVEPSQSAAHSYEDFSKIGLGVPDPGWFDRNTFQCLQCGFMSRSLELFDAHVKGYHSVSLNEFSPYIAKTNVMYRCLCCLQELYHEKSVIMNHLSFHNLDLESYAHIYLRQRTMY